MPHAPGHWGWEGPGHDPVPETKANQQIYVPPTTTTRPVSDAGNLSSLFGELNRISAPQIMMQNRAGGGTGGGSLALEGNMDPNPLSRFNPYLGMNVTSFNKGGKYRYDEGGQLTPKEMKKVQSLGRNGDTMLAHINPQEAAMLKAMGGSGTINPYTGLREYGWLSSFVKSILGGASDVAQAVINPLNDVVAPIFNAAGEVLDPLADVTTDVVQAAGDNVVSPIVEGIAGGSRDVLEFVGDKGSDIVRGAGGFVHDIYENLSDLFSGGDYSIQFPDYTKGQIEDPSREPQARGEGSEQSGLKLSPQSQLSKMQESKKSKLQEGDWVGDKPNPYIAPNVEEELDYAAKGMKMPRYNQGGMYEQAANEAIAQNQLSGLAANLFNRANNLESQTLQDIMQKAMNNSNPQKADNGMRMPSNEMVSELQRMIPNPQDAMNLVGQFTNNQPMAAYGMKRKYQEGGNYPHNMYHPETGYKIVAEDESAHNKLSKAGFGHTPKAAYGMKMKKRYTQGGRF